MERLLTPFGEKLDKKHPLSEYPRPQLVRNSYHNLNGIWEYAILPKGNNLQGYQGEIVVPFSPETILSGVEKEVTDKDVLYYRKEFSYKKDNDRVILHFGAVDYQCSVTLNNVEVGTHTGGYYAFSFDVTDSIVTGKNVIKVVVTDPGDTGAQARGKQSSNRGGIWYTPQSGIWQTVWLESVADSYIQYLKITPDIDNNNITFDIYTNKAQENNLKVAIFNDNGIVKEEVFNTTKKVEERFLPENVDKDCVIYTTSISFEEYELWSPENPYLYNCKIFTDNDCVDSYFGMRKFSIGKDESGISRLMLNNKPYFHNGLLDQGYWSDGMYTAPSDEALVYDIQTMKDMGFNMLRKHIKIEPMRWYYHCDRLGMLVWQDMINGGGLYNLRAIGGYPMVGLALCTKKVGILNDGSKNYKVFSRTNEQGREEYYVDSKRMVQALYNVTSLALWVPFNEGWGQFDALKAYDFYKELDDTRTIDHASGWNDQGGGDLNSFHIYFTRYKFPKHDKNDERPIALTEFGGFSLKATGHMYNTSKFFGYRKFYDKEKFSLAMRKLVKTKVENNIKNGLSATVYTEVRDFEDECNGLLSYDRKLVKIDIDVMKDINKNIKL